MRVAPLAVVIPAFRAAAQLPRVLDRLPAEVSFAIVVDDGSDDDTAQLAAAHPDPRVHLLRHHENRGVGAAIASGYAAALGLGAAAIVVMAGDDQMDPIDLPRLLERAARGDASYVKGNRLIHADARRMPWQRRLGSRWLAALTRAVGGPPVGDSQCGYTLIDARAVAELPLGELYPRYGYPNELLLMLAARGHAVAEVPVRPVYADERSGLRPWHLLAIAGLTLRRALRERRTAPPRWRASP
jgi:glycosyltransferase involved in cell wall biosynthesis